MAKPGTLHHAPDFGDETLVACGKGTVAFVKSKKGEVTCDPPSQFIATPLGSEDDERCWDCVNELVNKATRDDTPTSGGVLTSELPESQPEEPPPSAAPGEGVPIPTQQPESGGTPPPPETQGGGEANSEGPA